MDNQVSARTAPQLSRKFGFATAVFLVIANMVGSGILTTSGFILHRLPDHHTSLVLWLFGGLIALFGALSMAEMASAYPEAGGDFLFVHKAFGRRVGFAYGVSMLVLGFSAPLALVAYTLASLLWPFFSTSLALAETFQSFFCSAVATSLILVLSWLHVRGHRESANTQGVTTGFKLLSFVAFIGAAFLSTKVDWSNFATIKVVPTNGSGSWLASIGANFVLVMYCYTGWNGSIYIAGELKNPERNLTASLTAGTLLVSALYLAMNLVYAIGIPASSVGELSDYQRLMFSETISHRLFTSDMAKIFSIVMGLGIVASLSAYIMTGPRLLYAMAVEGLLPRHLANANPITQIPALAIWAQAAISIGMLWTRSAEHLLEYAGFGLGVLSLLIIAPLFWLRRSPHYTPTFKVPGYPYVPAIFILVNVAMLVLSAFENPWSALVGVASVLTPYLVFPWLLGRASHS